MSEHEYSIKEVIEQRFDEVDKHLEEIKRDGKETMKQATNTNGRVKVLEKWSEDAQKVIENTTQIAESTSISYKIDRGRLWTAIAIITLLGSTIITLSVLAIDNKIKANVSEAFAQYEADK